MRFLVTLLVALCAVSGAQAALEITADALSPSLKVDAKGNAEVSWLDSSGRQTTLVPPAGRTEPNEKLSGNDVSRAAAAGKLPFTETVRSALGDKWALQVWRPVPTQPEQLRFSRWHGAAPVVSGTYSRSGHILRGKFTYHGRPLGGTWRSPEGKRIRTVVYIESQTGAGWRRLIGVYPAKNGSFGTFIKKSWRARRYRLIGTGPTLGKWRLPDVVGFVKG